MPSRVEVKPKPPVFLLPYEFCKDIIESIAFCIVYRPVFTLFICSSITVGYLILSSQKLQQMIASLPYERVVAQFKSQRMITVYATVVEVVLELLMAVVLAGVSVIITLWLVFEEMADRKNLKGNLMESKLESRESGSLSVFHHSTISAKTINLKAATADC